MKYYSFKKIDKKEATYNIIFGERSNGKTYGMLKRCLENYFKNGSEFAYVRRWSEDIKKSKANTFFSAIINDGHVERLSNGEFTSIYYSSGKFYLCRYHNDKLIYNESSVIGYCFSLTDYEHNKSTSYPKVKTIVFDEFIASNRYMVDEFMLFMQTVSTIVRKRDDVKIYMLGNTISQYCPYFKEMGSEKNR